MALPDASPRIARDRREPATISVLVTTYNWKDALLRVLEGLARQTRLPDEVIVADDGSGPDTAALVAHVAHRYPMPLRHAWQEDRGFRVARARNMAIAAASSEYVLLLDGDMVPQRRFVADHAWAARRGCFVQGSRVLTGPELRDRMLAQADVEPTLLAAGIRRRRNALRNRALAHAWLALRPRSEPCAIKTCNQGWWRGDLVRLNGFDERMEGWGREDVELAWRAWHAGIRCRQLRFAGLAWHLHHDERHCDGESANDRYLDETRTRRLTRCGRGLDEHLARFEAGPLPDLRQSPRVNEGRAPDGALSPTPA